MRTEEGGGTVAAGDDGEEVVAGHDDSEPAAAAADGEAVGGSDPAAVLHYCSAGWSAQSEGRGAAACSAGPSSARHCPCSPLQLRHSQSDRPPALRQAPPRRSRS